MKHSSQRLLRGLIYITLSGVTNPCVLMEQTTCSVPWQMFKFGLPQPMPTPNHSFPGEMTPIAQLSVGKCI